MYRNARNEKVELSRANMPEDSTRKIGFGAVAAFAAIALKAARNRLTRMAMERELSNLDDRSLADIGLSRAMIATVAAKAVVEAGEPALGSAFATMLKDAIVAPIVLWRARDVAAHELHRLGDRELMDIGLTRSDIPSVVAAMGAKPASAPKADAMLGVGARTGALATANQLSRPGERMPSDLGVVRSDTKWLASAVTKKTSQSANRNQRQDPQPSAA